jgi:dipeptidyl aminopeptidase/acylaminoacyl peptidase
MAAWILQKLDQFAAAGRLSNGNDWWRAFTEVD